MFAVRKLIKSDDEQYCALWLHGITEHASYFRISRDDESTIFIPTRFTDDSFTLGAFSGSRLMGIISVERDIRKKMNHKALVFRMFVHPDAAGQGMGRQLLNVVIQEMTRLRTVRYLYLTVLASNPRAIHLYSTLGFSEYARELGGVQIDGQFVDELQMAYQIASKL